VERSTAEQTTALRAEPEPSSTSGDSGWLSTTWWWLAGLMGLAALVRLVGLTVEPLHVDEVRQAATYAGGIREAWDGSWLIVQPPLDHLIGWASTVLLGENSVAYRLPSAIAGTLTVVPFFLVVRRFAGVAPAIAAGLFTALAPLHVEYSQYARPYALPLLFFAIGLWAMAVFAADGTRLPWLTLAGVCAILPWSRTIEGTTSIVALASGVVAAVLFRLINPRRAFITLLAFIPGALSSVIVVTRISSNNLGFAEDQGFALSQISGTLRGARGLLSSSAGPTAFIVLVFGALGLLVLVLRQKAVPWLAVPLTAAIALGISSVWVILFRSTVPLFDRYGVFMLPAQVLAVGIAVAGFCALRPSRSAGAAAIAVAIAIGVSMVAEGVGDFATIIRPAHEAAALAADQWDGPAERVIIYQPGDLNAYRAAYPTYPPIDGDPQVEFKPNQWVPLDLRGLDGDGPTAVIWLPPITEAYTIDRDLDMSPPELPGYSAIRLKDGAAYFYEPEADTSTSVPQLLEMLFETDPTSGRVWALLGSASYAMHVNSDVSTAVETVKEVCEVAGAETVVEPGPIWGAWTSPALTMREFLFGAGFPVGSCS